MATLAPTPRLRGREVELRELGDAFGRLASGHPSIVLVEGEAGIGKTRLLPMRSPTPASAGSRW